MQAPSRTRFNASRLQSLRNPVHTQRALENLSRRGTEFRDIKRATGNAIPAADTMLLLEIDDAIHVLHDGAVGRTGDQASRLLAMHALVLAHQELQSAV